MVLSSAASSVQQGKLAFTVLYAEDLAEAVQRLAFERVLRAVLSFPNAPAVAVFMVVVPGSHFGSSVESELAVIAQHYQLPVLSTRYVQSSIEQHPCTLRVLHRGPCPDCTLPWFQVPAHHCVEGALRLCRGAFAELMSAKLRYFRVDGSAAGPAKGAEDDKDAFFFGVDGRHAAPHAYRSMSELAIFLTQQVPICSEFHVFHICTQAIPVKAAVSLHTKQCGQLAGGKPTDTECRQQSRGQQRHGRWT